MKLIIKFLPGQIYNHPTFLQGAGAQTFTDYVRTICTHLIHHCQPLQSTAVLAGRDDYSHDCSPRDDRGYNHPPAALLVLNWWTMSLSGVKLGNMS